MVVTVVKDQEYFIDLIKIGVAKRCPVFLGQTLNSPRLKNNVNAIADLITITGFSLADNERQWLLDNYERGRQYYELEFLC
jgi:hypothetical protein